MTDTVLTTSPEPDGAPRIATLDILRGIAILGILFMNVDGMGGALIAHLEPRVLGWSALDQAVWCLRQVFANGTARAMLEMLFGAGMVILTERVAESASRQWEVLARYYWRNIVLFGFGIVHIVVLGWFGDILHTYGLAAMIAFLFRRLPPRQLLVPGLSFAAFLAVAGGADLYQTARQNALVQQAQANSAAGRPQTPEQREAVRAKAAQGAMMARMEAKVAVAEHDRRGGVIAWWRANSGFYLFLLDQGYPFFWIWEAAATMLIGIALFRWGVIQGGRSTGFYLRLMAGGYLVGLLLRGVDAGQVLAAGGGAAPGLGLDEVARLATTLGHLSAVNLLLATATGRRLLSPFAAAGRTALSLYICQTVLVMWLIFSPLGLHLYDRLDWTALMALTVAVDAVLLLLANWWVRQFRIAPVEWAWRSIVEGRPLPFRRIPAVAEPALRAA